MEAMWRLRGGAKGVMTLITCSAQPTRLLHAAPMRLMSHGARAAFMTIWRTPMTVTARAGNRRFRRLSALRAHTKAPYKRDLHRKTLRNAKGA